MNAPTTELVADSALVRDNPLPLHTRLREDLRQRIDSRAWAPHQRLPSESALMRHYAVSRITVRHALQALEQQGLIVKVVGRGSFVAAPKPFQHLARLQGLGEAMATQGQIRNRVIDVSQVPADDIVAARLDLLPGTLVTHIQRVRLLDGRPLSVDLTWLPRALGDRVAAGKLESRDIFLMIEQDLGTPLGHADLALDAVAAPAAIAHALELAAGSPVLRVERLTHDRNGRPIDHEILYCRADNFQFRLRIDRQSGGSQ